VQFEGTFPVGDPEVLLGNAIPPLAALFGIVACTIMPPLNTPFPVLSLRVNDKLMNVLCNACAHEQNTETCRHKGEVRALTSVWTTLELKLAVRCGYKIMRMTEAWHFKKRSAYKPAANGKPEVPNLFTNFIRNMYRLKTHATGCMGLTPEELTEFAVKYAEKMGEPLDIALLIANPSLRAVAKLLLNSNCMLIYFN
jgi:hypothetical protein